MNPVDRAALQLADAYSARALQLKQAGQHRRACELALRARDLRDSVWARY
jgi:hypothetical protein